LLRNACRQRENSSQFLAELVPTLFEWEQDNTVLQFAECEIVEINESRTSELTISSQVFSNAVNNGFKCAGIAAIDKPLA
jgi:hypothetical protein